MTRDPNPTIVDETMEGALGQALRQVPGLVGLVLADADGLVLVSTFEEERGVPEASAMAAVAADIGRRMARHLVLGDFENVTFSFHGRYVYVSHLTGRRVQIVAVAKKNVNLGLLYLALDELGRALARFLTDFLELGP